jgi:hypothetical protein
MNADSRAFDDPPAGLPPLKGDPLWLAIETFPLDEAGAAFPFTQRLARDHLWTDDVAARVVGEYRRFLYLMATSTGTVTPSEAVDEAWHLHLSYTRSYWDDLCGKIIGRPLHHDPTKGGAEEAERFAAAYAYTLLRYRDVFGAAPPGDIWPDASVRFAADQGYRTVAVRDHWIMRRLWSPKVGQALTASGMIASFVGGGATAVWLFPTVGILVPVGCFAGLGAFQLIARSVWSGEGSLIFAVHIDADGDGGCGGCGGCGG